jgi:hypothetical protein
MASHRRRVIKQERKRRSMEPVGKGVSIMLAREFAAPGSGSSVSVFYSEDWENVMVLFNHGLIGTFTSREAASAGQAFALPDGSTLSVQLVGTQFRVLREGELLSSGTPVLLPQGDSQGGRGLLRLHLGHRVGNSHEPDPEGHLVRSGKELYRIQPLIIGQPAEQQTREVQVRCIYCGEEVPLQVFSRSSQIGQQQLLDRFIRVGTAGIVAIILVLLIHDDGLLILGILISIPFYALLSEVLTHKLVPPVSTRENSPQHRVLWP